MKLRVNLLDRKGLAGLFAVVFVLTCLTLYENFSDGDILHTEPSVAHIAAQKKLVIFPSSFQETKAGKALLAYYKLHLSDGKGFSKATDVLRYNEGPSSFSQKLKEKQFHEADLKMFDLNTEDCSRDAKDLKMQISNSQSLDSDLKEMVHVLMHQLQHEPAFEELKQYYKDDLRKQINEGTLRKHWYRFSGSSVWLKEHGVHLVITRAEYTTGKKTKPIMSLAYAQIFDRDWQELKDVELVVSTVNENEELEYEAIKFPRFLPIPFYHDAEILDKRFYGPEDPRVFLVQSEHGEEPVIIVNAYHRKLAKGAKIDETKSEVSYTLHRSMFMVWPFRYQRGKLNVNGHSDKYDDLIYNKIVELKLKNQPRLQTQKNWTPFLSNDEKLEFGYHKYVYFVYRWSQLEILKCNLDKFFQGVSECEFAYKRMEDSSKEDVGPLRGGTAMINLREIVTDKDVIQNSHKEIWVGFPRAHLRKCGCGRDLYRPNLAIITREGDTFKISQLSSFVSLDMKVYGWANPENSCNKNEANALISNGVSSWIFEGNDDYLTLTVSVADEYNYVIHFKNLMKLILRETEMTTYDLSRGLDENIIKCAMDASVEFCKAYGEEIKHAGQ